MQASSGSALINEDGYAIVTASIAYQSNLPQNCTKNPLGQDILALNVISFSKLSYVWEYSVDGGGNDTKLKPWLDPTNTSTLIAKTVTTECKPVSGGSVSIESLDNIEGQIHIFPNPSTNGKVTIGFNLTEKINYLKPKVIDINGRVIQSGTFPSVQTSNIQNYLSSHASRMGACSV